MHKKVSTFQKCIHKKCIHKNDESAYITKCMHFFIHMKINIFFDHFTIYARSIKTCNFCVFASVIEIMITFQNTCPKKTSKEKASVNCAAIS